ncbi:MAG TPA: methyltransferase [Papillibacter sp.]|jgi:hypothetical protein|nr:methyltransferase [Papillibacter sp.]
MSIPKFDPKELEVVGKLPSFGGGQEIPIYNYPVTPKEAYKAAFNRKPYWQIASTTENRIFTPKCNPDNIARGFVFDGTRTPPTGGIDMFGIDWEYVPQVGGSMVRPGKPFIEDASELPEKVVWPNIDEWDWEECAKANVEYLAGDQFNMCWFLNGWYERLISFMDFEGAIMAIFDEDSKEYVKDFFDKLSDLYIRIFDKYLEYFPQIDGFCIHDDWGSQKETFFSPAVAEEMLVPYMRRVTDFLHSKGKFCELHSCGQLMKQVPNMIEAGWDSWHPQLMNDTQKEYELYGDKILIGVAPDEIDPNATEEEIRQAARDFANKFCNPEKPSLLNIYTGRELPIVFLEELYKQSRINYSK